MLLPSMTVRPRTLHSCCSRQKIVGKESRVLADGTCDVGSVASSGRPKLHTPTLRRIIFMAKKKATRKKATRKAAKKGKKRGKRAKKA